MNRLLTFLTLTLLFTLAAASTSLAQSFEAGRKAANSGDYKTALKNWRPLAESGHSEAQLALGRMYARGDGVKKDFMEARKWFTKSARSGNRQACEKLALMYGAGDGVKRNSEFAKLWDDAAKGLISVEEVEARINPATTVKTAVPAAPTVSPTKSDDLVAVPPPLDFMTEGTAAHTAAPADVTPSAAAPSPASVSVPSESSENIDSLIKELDDTSGELAGKERDTWLARGVSFEDFKRCLTVDLHKEVITGYVPPRTSAERWLDTVQERLQSDMKTKGQGKLPLGCEKYFGTKEYEDPAAFKEAVEKKVRETK